MDELRAEDPRRIGAYRLVGRLGTGGMGRVYLARSPRGRTVAVKVVRAELAGQDEFRIRFRREVRAARQVGGRWTAPVLDADTEAAIPWVVTGYVPGPSLREVVSGGYGPLPAASVRVLASGLAHALSDIHAAGLVHRDLKPSNVMITLDGPRVIDFGIARALETVAGDGMVTYTGAMLGSPAFMSPEQIRGDRVTPACDVFCMGSVLAYAATGLQPFGAASSGVHAQMFRIVQEPPDLGAVPAELREVIAACLSKEPERRPTPSQVRERLEAGGGPGWAAGASWLPEPIVAGLGRQAVRLLELEAAETGPLARIPAWAERAEPEPGEADRNQAEQARAEQTPAERARAEQTRAEQARLDAPAERPSAREQPTEAAPAQEPRTHAAPAATAPEPMPAAQPEPMPTSTAATSPDPVPPPARAPRRPRALVAVLTVAALAAAGTAAYATLHGGHDDGASPARDAASSAARRLAVRDPVVPAAMVGTWRASFTGGSVSGENVRTLTVGLDGSVRLTGDGPSYHCEWTMRVVRAGPPVALGPSTVVSGPAASCLPGGPTTLALLGPGRLRRDNVESGRSPLTYTKAR